MRYPSDLHKSRNTGYRDITMKWDILADDMLSFSKLQCTWSVGLLFILNSMILSRYNIPFTQKTSDGRGSEYFDITSRSISSM